MGSFIDEKAIINRNIESYNNYVNSKGRFMEGTPTFVTYYRFNREASTEDVGLGNTIELIGANSPIKFDKIQNMPIYSFEGLELAYEYDSDKTIEISEISGSGIIPANTIKPYPDDYFCVSYLDKNLIFRVNNVSGNTLGKKFYYKIEFSYSNIDIDILEERQINEVLNVNYDTVGGSKNSPIIESGLFERLELIEQLISSMNIYYDKYYYNRNFNTYMYENIYDNFLHIFLSRNRELTVNKNSFMKNKFIIPLLGESFADIKMYENTIYNFIDEKRLENSNTYLNTDTICNTFSIQIIPKGQTNPYGRSYKEYNEIIWQKNNAERTFITDILNDFNINKNESNNSISKALMILSDNSIKLSSKCDKILESINDIHKHINYSLEEYIYYPCLLLILQELINRILKETKDKQI